MRHNYFSLKGTAQFNKAQLFWLFIAFLFFPIESYAQESLTFKKLYLATTATADTLVIPDRFYLIITMNEAHTNGRVSTEEIESKMKSRLSSLGLYLGTQLALVKASSNHRRFFLRSPDIYKSKEYTILPYDIETANKIIVELESVGILNIRLQKVEFSDEKQVQLNLRKRAM